MSVITCKQDDFYRARCGEPSAEKCTVCPKLMDFPFLHWACCGSGPDIYVCGDCCLHIRDGLMADLIWCAAATEMQRLDTMRGYTLIRRMRKVLERETEEIGGVRDQEFIAHLTLVK
jgi:hypothetical protein